MEKVDGVLTLKSRWRTKVSSVGDIGGNTRMVC